MNHLSDWVIQAVRKVGRCPAVLTTKAGGGGLCATSRDLVLYALKANGIRRLKNIFHTRFEKNYLEIVSKINHSSNAQRLPDQQ
jgi:hypothetical protein